MRLFQRTVSPRANVVPERVTASSLIYIANDRNLPQPSGTSLLARTCLWQRHVSVPLRFFPQSALPSPQELAYGTRVSVWGGFILTSVPRAAPTSWNSPNYAANMAPRSRLRYITTGASNRSSSFYAQRCLLTLGGDEDEDEDRPTDVSVQKWIFA